MSVSTSNIGRRVDGTFEEYAPPKVVTIAGGGGDIHAMLGPVVTVANGALFPAGTFIPLFPSALVIATHGPTVIYGGDVFVSDGTLVNGTQGVPIDLLTVLP